MPTKAISTKPYADVARAGKPAAQNRQILGLYDVPGRDVPLNRRMIGELTKLPINVICWRVNGLIKSGLLEVVGEIRDPVTDQDTEILFPTSGKVRQMELKL